jgi:PAS domain-containing protein
MVSKTLNDSREQRPGETKGAAVRLRLEELEKLYELLPVGVAIARDREGKEMVANATFCRIVGIEPGRNPSKTGAEANRLPFRVVKNGVDVPPEELPLQRAAREGINVSGLCHIMRQDGRDVMLQGETVPLTDSAGTPCGSVGVFVDVTERSGGSDLREDEAPSPTG